MSEFDFAVQWRREEGEGCVLIHMYCTEYSYIQTIINYDDIIVAATF